MIASLAFDRELAVSFRGATQRTRIMSEAWVGAHIGCPACGHTRIDRFDHNRPVADFYCKACLEQFELKSLRGAIGRKIEDGAYRTMIDRITSDTNPNFLFLSYDKDRLAVTDLLLVPKHFVSPETIECRKPLSSRARRAGWQGCRILMDAIPALGRIDLIRQGRVIASRDIMRAWNDTLFLREQPSLATRTWLLAVLACIERIGTPIFTIDQLYAFEPVLAMRFPANRNIRPKIRQQLQVLRDGGVVVFLGRGSYRWCLADPKID